MKILTTLLIFASILLIVGCAAPEPSTKELPTQATEPTQVDEVDVISEDVTDVASLEDELGLDELEGIDEDLDLGL